MLVGQDHQSSGTHSVQRVIRFSRAAFLLRSSEDFRRVVKGACALSGGIFWHLIPVQNGQLDDVWSSYIQRLLPDAVYIPTSFVDLKSQLQKLTTGYVSEVDYGEPVTWGPAPHCTAYWLSAIQTAAR